MREPTLPFAPTKTYGLISENLREKRKPLFPFLSLSLSLTHSLSSARSLPLPPSFFSSLSSFSSHPPKLLFFFFCSSHHFLFVYLLFLFFFLLSFIFSYISFSLLASLFDPHQTNWSSGETSSPLSLLDTCHALYFSFFFLFFFILHLTLGSM